MGRALCQFMTLGLLYYGKNDMKSILWWHDYAEEFFWARCICIQVSYCLYGLISQVQRWTEPSSMQSSFIWTQTSHKQCTKNLSTYQSNCSSTCASRWSIFLTMDSMKMKWENEWEIKWHERKREWDWDVRIVGRIIFGKWENPEEKNLKNPDPVYHRYHPTGM